MIPNTMEHIISNAGKGGWSWFQSADENVRKALETKQKLAAEDASAIAHAWADFAATPGGRKALDHLFDTTLRRTVYFANLGVDIHSMAVWGAFREGQNALAQEIARQIGKGRNEEVKPRETT